MKKPKFAENLKLALATKGISQKVLADKLGTTQATVSRWVNGENEPAFELLLEICDILDETPNTLLGYEEN